jgi:hypothetical protein
MRRRGLCCKRILSARRPRPARHAFTAANGNAPRDQFTLIAQTPFRLR